MGYILYYFFKLNDPVCRFLNVCRFAPWAVTGTGKAFSFFKNVSALQTQGGLDKKSFPLCCDRACNVREVRIDLLFRDPQFLGDLDGAHLFFAQEIYHLLTNRFHTTHHLPFRCLVLSQYSTIPSMSLKTGKGMAILFYLSISIMALFLPRRSIPLRNPGILFRVT